MFLANLRANPNDNSGIQARRVSQQLSEMAVVGGFQLILDNNPAGPCVSSAGVLL
jgi:hypothetical protein